MKAFDKPPNFNFLTNDCSSVNVIDKLFNIVVCWHNHTNFMGKKKGKGR